jgi:TRAP-type C4-dicarboxylate transport system permease large subunit
MKTLISLSLIFSFLCINPYQSLAVVMKRDTVGLISKSSDSICREKLKMDYEEYEMTLVVMLPTSIPLILTAFFAKSIISEVFLAQFITGSLVVLGVYALLALIGLLLTKKRLKKKVSVEKKSRFFNSLFSKLLFGVILATCIASFFALFITYNYRFLGYFLSIFHLIFGLSLLSMLIHFIFTGEFVRS